VEREAGRDGEGWRQVAALGVSLGGVLVAGMLAAQTLVAAPLAVRVERMETTLQQAERGRTELLVRLGGVERQAAAVVAGLRAVERRLDGLPAGRGTAPGTRRSARGAGQ
jgi:hypothetical protein